MTTGVKVTISTNVSTGLVSYLIGVKLKLETY